MRRHGGGLKRGLEAVLDRGTGRSRRWGVFLLALVAVAREGGETAVFLHGMLAGVHAALADGRGGDPRSGELRLAVLGDVVRRRTGMSERRSAEFLHAYRRPFAVVLGTSEIASAAALHLHRAGFATILSHDPFPPVIRRSMAFHDALFGDRAALEEVEAERAEDAVTLITVLARPARVAVTMLGLVELIAIRSPDVLVDARLQKHRVTPDLRRIVKLAVGLGPNFRVDANCDIAVETRPTKTGRLVTAGETDAADGIASRLGRVGGERFVYSDRPGLWHTPIEIGMRVFKGLVVGRLDGLPVHAPLDGILRGVVRDGSKVPPGVKLIEVDPRGRKAQWTGIDERSRAIAMATLDAIRLKMGDSATANARVGSDATPSLMSGA